MTPIIPTLRRSVRRVALSCAIAFVAILESCAPARADSLVTLTITVTSAPTSGATLTVNGSTRIWTNSVSTPASQIATTNAVGPSATNLYAHLASQPLPGPLALTFASSNIITLRAPLNGTITASASSGWATLALATNTLATSMITVRVPASAEAQAVRRYVADQLVETIGANALTSSFAASTPALAGFVSLTATQTLSGPKTFAGGLTAASLTATGIVNRGAAISSPGSAGGSEQFGGLASATGTNSLAVGPQAVATARNATALGSAAEAGASNAVAVGRAALGSAVDAIAVGSGSTASGLRSTAIGSGAAASGMDSVALGKGASDAGHSNAVAIGTGSTATSAWDLVLGSVSHLVRIPGRLIGAVVTNGTFHGTVSVLTGGLISGTTVSNAIVYATGGLLSGVTVTNAVVHATGGTASGLALTGGSLSNAVVRGSTFSDTSTVTGQWRWSMTTSTSLANGVNSGVSPGDGVFLKIASGPTGNFTIAGISGGGAGRLLALYNATGQIMTVANESGSEATSANRIRTLSGLDITTTGSALMWLLYDAGISRWVVTSLSGITVAGNTNLWTVKGASVFPGNLADSASVVWTVTTTNITATLTNAVTSVNGLQGAVTVVTSVNGSTGDVTTPTLGASQIWSGINTFEGGLISPGSGSGSTKLGPTVSAAGQDSIAIGYASARSLGGISIGWGAASTNQYALAIGAGANATGDLSTAVGYDAKALHAYSTALGQGAQTTASQQVRIGTSTDSVSVPGTLQIAGTLDIPSGIPIQPPASTGRLYVTVNGGGKLVLCVKWPDGSTNTFATQP